MFIPIASSHLGQRLDGALLLILLMRDSPDGNYWHEWGSRRGRFKLLMHRSGRSRRAAARIGLLLGIREILLKWLL